MKILHVIDSNYFETHKKVIIELVLALKKYGIEQKIYANSNIQSVDFEDSIEIVNWDATKLRSFILFQKFFTVRLLSTFQPDVIIKYGIKARYILKNTRGLQISYMEDIENPSTIENSDYIMTTAEPVLEYFKNNGFSGSKSFILPNFIYSYTNQVYKTKKDLFIPEKASVIYLASRFKKNIGYEWVFQALGIDSNKYCVVAGLGDSLSCEYVEECALLSNLKIRSRFITDIKASYSSLLFSDLCICPFNDPSISKYILEAMLNKKPVITIRNSITEDLIVDGDTGFIIPNKDMYLIKKKLKAILTLSNDILNKITENAYAKAINFTESKIIPVYINVFDDLIKTYNFLNLKK